MAFGVAVQESWLNTNEIVSWVVDHNFECEPLITAKGGTDRPILKGVACAKIYFELV